MLLLQELLKREGEHFQTPEGSIIDMINVLYQRAAYDRKWSAVRRGAALLKKLVDSLAPGITTLLVSGKVVRCFARTCYFIQPFVRGGGGGAKVFQLRLFKMPN